MHLLLGVQRRLLGRAGSGLLCQPAAVTGLSPCAPLEHPGGLQRHSTHVNRYVCYWVYRDGFKEERDLGGCINLQQRPRMQLVFLLNPPGGLQRCNSHHDQVRLLQGVLKWRPGRAGQIFLY